MGAASKIEWTHHTFNAWLGCAKVHTGCTNCYAENEQAVVMRKGGRVNWGEVWQGGDRVVVADSTWAKPFTWSRAAAKAGERHRVFCESLSDVLEVPSLPETWPSSWDEKQIAWATERVQRIGAEMGRARERLWDTIRQTAYCGVDAHGRLESFTPTKPDATMRIGGLDWLLLTKRPEEWQRIPEDVRPLVWLGTSVSNQETADEWVPRLLQAEGFRYRFLSVEPMVGMVDLTRIPGEIGVGLHSRDVLRGWNVHHDDGDKYTEEPWAKVDWVIIGGESGPKARPCNVEWVRDIIRQCREAGVPCFVKQLGAEPVDAIDRWHEWRALGTGFDSMSTKTGTGSVRLEDHKGRDPAEWPEDLRAREFPLTR